MVAAHLDYESLNGLKEVMGEEFPLLVDTFINDSDVRIETIRDAVNAADPEAIRRTSHSLKGSASNMGATQLTQLCRELEDMGHDGRSDGAEDILQKVIVEYAAVRDALKAV